MTTSMENCAPLGAERAGTQSTTECVPEAELIKEKGNALFGRGDYEGALVAYEEAIEVAPATAVYYSNASACCAKLNEFGKAALFAAEALRLDPTMSKAYYRRGVALMGLSQWKPALEDLRKAAKSSGAAPQSEAAARISECEKELQRIAFARAIHIEVFELEMKNIKRLDVDASYAGPCVADDQPITFEFVKHLAEWYREERRLHPHYVYRVLFEARKLFRALPTVVHVPIAPGSRFTVCGDIHGQFFDLVHIFDINGYPSEKHGYLFNGDIVDRGQYSVEVLLFLCALKAAFPENFFIARGNHESESVNRMHGFYEEVCRKYDDARMFPIMNQVLETLPLAHVIQDSFFVVHGGLPANGKTVTVEEINKINRFCAPEPGSVMSQLLWSDPQDADGLAPSNRGEGVLFGPDVTESFLLNNGLSKIIRSHVWESEGYRIHHNGKCITIFSAPDYTGTVSQGAVINISPDLQIKFKQYDSSPLKGRLPKPRAGSRFNSWGF